MAAPLALADVVAIDIHTPVHASVHDHHPEDNSPLQAMDRYFGSDGMRANVHEMASYYRERIARDG